MTDPTQTAKWTEGVCEDGAAILRDGVPVAISEILAILNGTDGAGTSVRYGCHVELFAMPEGAEPDGCVIDEGLRQDCIYASDITCKEQCRYWQAITPESIRQARGE